MVAVEARLADRTGWAATTLSAGRAGLPVLVLLWCVMVERLEPALAAFWSVSFVGFVLLSEAPLLAWFGGRADGPGRIRRAGAAAARRLVDGVAEAAALAVPVALGA